MLICSSKIMNDPLGLKYGRFQQVLSPLSLQSISAIGQSPSLQNLEPGRIVDLLSLNPRFLLLRYGIKVLFYILLTRSIKKSWEWDYVPYFSETPGSFVPITTARAERHHLCVEVFILLIFYHYGIDLFHYRLGHSRQSS